MDREQSQTVIEYRRNGSGSVRAQRSDGKEVTSHKPIADTATTIIARLVAEAHVTAGAVLRTISEDLAAQEKVVLFEYLRYPAIKQVAVRLGKHDQTIRNQLTSIRGKLEVSTLCELIGKVLLAHMAQELAGPVKRQS